MTVGDTVSTPAIQVVRVTKSYGEGAQAVTALEAIDLVIEDVAEVFGPGLSVLHGVAS